MRISRISVTAGCTALVALVFAQWAAFLHAGVAVRIGQNFTGSTDSQNWFPDPSGAASVDYFAEFNFDTFAVYAKADGSLVKTLSWSDFWSNAGVPFPATWGSGDVHIIYDPSVQRWFVAEIVVDPASQTPRPTLAVSATADPTGAWHGAFILGAAGLTNASGRFSLGLDAQAVYIADDAKPITSGSTFLLCLPKTDLLSISPVLTNLTFFGVLAGTDYGFTPLPAICLDGSAEGTVVGTTGQGNPGQNNTNLVAFAVQNAAGPGPATLGNPRAIPVPDYFNPQFALQPDGSINLVDGDATFTANVYCSGGALFATGVTQVGPRVAIRWYRLNATNHTLLETGTISDPSLDLYCPSIAANTNGAVVLAFNGSGTNTFPSCYAAVGQTVNGVTTFGNLLLLKAGVASYQNLDPSGNNLWGRYSTTCVDPTDPNVFWTINAYAAGTNTWATQITQILTSPSPQLSVANGAGGLLLSWPVTTVPFQLQSSTDLTNTNPWQPVLLSPITNGAAVSLLLPATNASAFFRLIQSQ